MPSLPNQSTGKSKRTTRSTTITPRDSSTLGTLERGLKVLVILAGSEAGPTELARKLDVDRATVHRILRTLVKCGFVKRVGSSGRYRTNLQHLLALTGEMTSQGESSWLVLAKSYLDELHSATGLSANLGVPSGNDIVYLAQVLGDGLSVHRPPGTRRPLHASALGKACLGSLSESELAVVLSRLELPRFTPHTITSPSALRNHLLEWKAKGYYVDRGEFNPSIRCVAATVFDQFGQAIASVGVSGPADDLAGRREAEIGARVADAARRMSMALGYLVGDSSGRPR